MLCLGGSQVSFFLGGCEENVMLGCAEPAKNRVISRIFTVGFHGRKGEVVGWMDDVKIPPEAGMMRGWKRGGWRMMPVE